MWNAYGFDEVCSRQVRTQANVQRGRRQSSPASQPRRSKLEPHRNCLLGLIAADSDLTVADMQERLRSEAGVSASVGTTHFRKKTADECEHDLSDVVSRPEAWFESQLDLDPARHVSIDETWTWTFDQDGATSWLGTEG